MKCTTLIMGSLLSTPIEDRFKDLLAHLHEHDRIVRWSSNSLVKTSVTKLQLRIRDRVERDERGEWAGKIS